MKLALQPLSGLVLLAIAPAVLAGTAPYFNPLTQSTAVATANHINEQLSPWQAPAGMSQINLTSLSEIEASPGQSIVRVPGLGRVATMIDMLAFDPSGRYLFMPHETAFGAGLSRLDLHENKSEILLAGDLGASDPVTNGFCVVDGITPGQVSTACPAWDFDYGAFDPARWTPNGTVWVAEEWSGLGRVIEILDPTGAAPADPTARPELYGSHYREITTIANVAHEGINFSRRFHNQVIYYVDEWNSGSIYALVLKQPGDYLGGGQTFVLRVDDFLASGGEAGADWNQGGNADARRFGLATWVPVTNSNGQALPGVPNPFRDGISADPATNPNARGGRAAADAVGGTPFGRPEDVEVGTLANFHEVVYVTLTSERRVISIEILGGGKAMVRELVSDADTPKNVGFPSTTAVMNSPDNLAQDALGNIYVVEDSPNSGNVGGDVWFVRDTDNNGVAESLDHFMSLQVAGSESTGMVFDPINPGRFVISVQHPASTDLEAVPNGIGDAIWEFNIFDAVPPPCKALSDFNACEDSAAGSFLKSFAGQLEAARKAPADPARKAAMRDRDYFIVPRPKTRRTLPQSGV